MKNIIIAIVTLLIVGSCQKPKGNDHELIAQKLEKSYKNWWLYFNDSIQLSSDFIALDVNANPINKATFLKSLSEGKCIPVKSTNTSERVYKLCKLGTYADENISITIKNLSEMELSNFKREGKKMNTFNFTDLSGNKYTNENTLGKTVVLKCWFIHCKKCVEEMPMLNKLVAHYKSRKDLVFISLAFDSEDKLETFLVKRKFDYAVVPNQEEYLKTNLGITIYPTHYIINKNGVVAKVTNDGEVLRETIKKMLQ